MLHELFITQCLVVLAFVQALQRTCTVFLNHCHAIVTLHTPSLGMYKLFYLQNEFLSL